MRAEISLLDAEDTDVELLGEISYRIVIEEVSPHAGTLARFPYEGLNRLGWKPIEISLEW